MNFIIECWCAADCWHTRSRAADNSLQADTVKFPSGIKAVADAVHAKGLKFGIYSDAGFMTCAGYPGSRSGAILGPWLCFHVHARHHAHACMHARTHNIYVVSVHDVTSSHHITHGVLSLIETSNVLGMQPSGCCKLVEVTYHNTDGLPLLMLCVLLLPCCCCLAVLHSCRYHEDQDAALFASWGVDYLKVRHKKPALE